MRGLHTGAMTRNTAGRGLDARMVVIVTALTRRGRLLAGARRVARLTLDGRVSRVLERNRALIADVVATNANRQIRTRRNGEDFAGAMARCAVTRALDVVTRCTVCGRDPGAAVGRIERATILLEQAGRSMARCARDARIDDVLAMLERLLEYDGPARLDTEMAGEARLIGDRRSQAWCRWG
jgi:hypothetical protein